MKSTPHIWNIKLGSIRRVILKISFFLHNSLKVVGAKFVLTLNIPVARICWFLMRIGTGLIFQRMILLWVRLNYATTHHHHSQPTKIYPPHPPSAKTHPPLPTISQKMGHRPAKTKIYSYITSFRHWFKFLFLSNAIFLSLTEILYDKV